MIKINFSLNIIHKYSQIYTFHMLSLNIILFSIILLNFFYNIIIYYLTSLPYQNPNIGTLVSFESCKQMENTIYFINKYLGKVVSRELNLP